MAYRMNVHRANVEWIGVGMHHVDVSLMSCRGKRGPEITPVAGTGKLGEKSMCGVIFIITPIPATLTIPIPIVEEAVLLLPLAACFVGKVTFFKKSIPPSGQIMITGCHLTKGI